VQLTELCEAEQLVGPGAAPAEPAAPGRARGGPAGPAAATDLGAVHNPVDRATSGWTSTGSGGIARPQRGAGTVVPGKVGEHDLLSRCRL
jgi:hypothetical protein